MNSSDPAAGSTRLLSCLLVCACLSGVSPLSAQLAKPAKSDPQQLAKYDKNKNGVLDADEIRAMDADVAATGSASMAPDDNVVELSPFEVVSDNHGYLASNTMSGTRLNSKIEDLGAAISVITKQQLVDTAAIDINDVFQTEIGTEGTNQFTDQSIDFQGRVIDNVQASPYTANRVRGLASANITTDGFTSTTRIPFDVYNLDSIELSRGPNSSLSGLGDAGGTVNLNQSRANLTRDTSQIVFRSDNWGGYRSSFDLNRPLLKNKLAIRVAGLYDSKGFRRKPSEDIQRRIYATFTYKPFAKTTLSGSFESYHQFRRTPNASTPTDMVTDWFNGGRPTWDPITSTVHLNGASVGTFTNSGNENTVLPQGLGRDDFFANFPSMFIEPDGQVKLYTQNRLQNSGAAGLSAWGNSIRLMTTYSNVARFRNATSGQAYPLDSLVGVSDKNIYDYENINISAPNWSSDKAELYKLQLEQKLFSTSLQQSYFQVAWRLEDSDDYNHNNWLNETSNVYIDVNEKLLDGTPNPYFLRPYVNGIQRTATSNPIYNDTVRAQLSYTLDLHSQSHKWLSYFGRHQALGYYEMNHKNTATYQYRELVASDVPWTNPANRFDGANTRHGTITDRYYIGNPVASGSTQVVDYAPYSDGIASGAYNFHYASNVVGPNVTFADQSVNVVSDGYGGAQAARQQLRTYGGALQSFFLQDRLVTTVGYRNDMQKNRQTAQSFVIDPTTGYGTSSNLDTYGDWTEREGSTTTYQGVVRPFKDLKALTTRSNAGGVGGYLADLIDGFQLQYSYADSFRPTSPAVNLYGEALGNPHGVGRDWGFSLHTPDNKFVVRVNWYKTYQYASPLVGQFSLPVIIARDLETNPAFGLETFARNVITARPQYAGASEAQIQSAIYDFVQLPQGFYDKIRAPQNVTDVNDQLSKGTEIELNYNPSRNLTFRFTATQTKAIDLTLVESTAKFIAERAPLWSTIANDAGQTWWSVTPLAKNLYQSQIVPNLLRMTANLGKPRSQDKEWTWSALTTYRFTSGKLDGLAIGSTIRWADKSTIGFNGIMGSNGVVSELDYNSPVYDPARASYDFMISYNLRLFHDKVRARVQLNGKDVFSHRGLRATSWNPEGYPATFRILDGSQWVLSTTFDL